VTGRAGPWVAVGAIVGALLFASCRSPISSALDPHPLDPVEQGEYRGLAPRVTGEVGDYSDEVGLLARVFYTRIINRRFNSIATYHDPALRELFRSSEAFADYFAALADALTVAHFEDVRPTQLFVEQVDVLDADVALVTVRYGGQSSLPLRWTKVALVQTDRWQRTDGRWWIIPGKL
jgi:hypothetical protein